MYGYNGSLGFADTGDTTYHMVRFVVAGAEGSDQSRGTSQPGPYVLGSKNVGTNICGHDLIDQADHGDDVLVFFLTSKFGHRSNDFQATLRVGHSHHAVEPVDGTARHCVVPLVLTAGQRMKVWSGWQRSVLGLTLSSNAA